MKNNNYFAVASRIGLLRILPSKVFASLLFSLVLCAGVLSATAQNARIVHTVVKQHTNPPELGRDYWFAPIQNYLDEPGKYYRLYITSPNNTTAFVESQGIVKAVPVASYGVGTFDMPLNWEMKSSGVVEDKGIHVYDPTDDICVYMMSENPFTSDGERLIPTTGWGTDYVVVGYEALFEGSGSYVFDFPSEFTIAADQDNTIVEITPSEDLRQAAIYPENNTVAAYPQGQRFEVTLNRGQSIQFQTVKAQDADNFDVTGTVIHANVGVNISAGSTCPNIPPDFPYCDMVEDQVPPIRTWAETYYTVNSAQPQGMVNKFSNLFCIVSSVPNQTIYRYDNQTGLHTEAVLGPAYDHYYVEEEDANRWTSDKPFLLFYYLNSASYPDGVNGNGDPASCPITPVENFTKDVVFEAPTSSGKQAPYDNYASVIVNCNDEANVFFDGHNIRQYTKAPVDNVWEVYLIPHISATAHKLTSDSGVGVYIYGYGFDESYAWSGGFGNGTFHSPDTVPPMDVITGECFTANIHLTDSGYLPGSSTLMQSGLNEIRLDTDINMAYLPDPYPAWIEGAQMDTSGYSMYVVDETKPARLVIDIFDAAGNETTITSTYIPQVASITPPLQDFGVANALPAPPVIMYDTITNLGKVPFNFTTLSLLYGNRGFTILSTPKAPLAVGQQGLIKISFSPIQKTAVVDSVVFGDACGTQEVALIGSGGAPDFYVADVVWQNVPLNPVPGKAPNTSGWTPKAAVIHNLSSIDTIHVSNTGWGDQAHFKFADTLGGIQTFPVAVPPAKTYPVWYWFEPTTTARIGTQASWTAPEVDSAANGYESPRYDSLIGNAITPTLSFSQDTTVTLNCEDTSVHSIPLQFILSNTGSQDAVITGVIVTNPTNFTNLTGYDQHGVSWNPATQEENIPPGSIDTFKVRVPINPQSNSSVTTQIYATTLNGLIGDTLTATVNVEYSAYSVSTPTIPFGPSRYQAVQTANDTQSFQITNTTSSDLVINSLGLIQGGGYNPAYSYKTVPPLVGTTPDTILPGQSMNVTVVFDPSYSVDSAQQAIMQINANSCTEADVTFNGYVTVWGAALTNFTPTPILDCGNHVDTILIVNGQASDEAEGAEDTIISATWLGGGANFSIPKLDNTVIPGPGRLPVAVTFTPNQGPQVNQRYTDQLQVVLHRERSGDTTLTETITGNATSFTIAANSTFGSNANSASAGGSLNLPIAFTFNSNGLPGGSLSQLGITQIVLTYNIANPGLLTPGMPTGLPVVNGTKWALTANGFVWNPVTGQLVITMTGPALTDPISSLGNIPFTVYLDKSDDGSNVTLSTMQLMKSDGSTIGDCVSQSVQSGAMSLILKCGDSTLRLLMSGNGNLINIVNPATPDPVTGGHVTFSYANRGATNITMTLLDVLGHEVMRPIDNVYHDAGSWQITSDVASLPSGTYTYRLSAEGNVVSKQFVIQR